MKTSFALAASLSTILLLGCQNSSPPAAVRDQSRAAQPLASTSQPEVTETGAGAESQTEDDQPDDPGMTTAHDKTLKQEEPSGDESSRAGPNEGDAEPPQ
ncbi:MAG TPA: hypothetical protein VG826_09440 [Pirellulales bacterium]|nr:hypothetical protein [Pirellulales bacterium]